MSYKHPAVTTQFMRVMGTQSVNSYLAFKVGQCNTLWASSGGMKGVLAHQGSTPQRLDSPMPPLPIGEQDEGHAHQDEHPRSHARAGTCPSTTGLAIVGTGCRVPVDACVARPGKAPGEVERRWGEGGGACMSASTAWPSCPEQASAADAAPHWEAFFARLREHYPISEEAATRFKAAASVHRFEKGVKLLKPGVGVDFVMLLLSGSVEVSAQGVPCPLPYPYPYQYPYPSPYLYSQPLPPTRTRTANPTPRHARGPATRYLLGARVRGRA